MQQQPYQPPYGGYPPPAYQPPAPVPPPPNPYKKPIRRNTNIVCGALIVLFILMYTLPDLFYAIVDAFEIDYYDIPELVFWLADIAISALTFVLPIVFIKAMTAVPTVVAFPMRAPHPGLTISGLFLLLGVTIIGSFISYLLGSLIDLIAGVTPYMASVAAPRGVWEIIAYAFSSAVCPAVLEELLFRGVILQTLRRYGDGFALVVSSILFGLAHGNLVQIPGAFLSGLVIGYFVLRTGSLLTGMIFHFVNNALATSVDVVGAFSIRWATVLNNLYYPVYILLGIIGLIWLQAGYRVTFRVMPSDYPLRESTKYGMFFSSGAAIVFVLLSIAMAVYYTA